MRNPSRAGVAVLIALLAIVGIASAQWSGGGWDTGGGSTTSGGGFTVYNVKSYGAVGNGSTDDTAAITAAYTALANHSESENGWGGVLYFPAGTYLFSALDFSFPTQNRHLVRLVGDGSGTNVLGTASTTLRCTGAGIAIKLARAIVQHLRLETTTATHGLYMTVANTDSRIEDVTVSGFSSYGVWWSGFSGTIRDAKITKNNTNIYLAVNAFNLEDSVLENWSAAGVELENCTLVNIRGNTIETGAGPAIFTNTSPSSNINITGNYFEAITAIAGTDAVLRFSSAMLRDSTVADNYFNLSSKANVYAVHATNVRDTQFRGNRVTNNAVGGLYSFSGSANYGNWLSDTLVNASTTLSGIGWVTDARTISGIGTPISHTFFGRQWFASENNNLGGAQPSADAHFYGDTSGNGGTSVFVPVILQNRASNGNNSSPGVQIIAKTGAYNAPYNIGSVKFLKNDTANGRTILTINSAGADTAMVTAAPGYVQVGDGIYNSAPLRLGSWYVWVNSTGGLCNKSSAPSSDTDGTCR